MLDTYTISPRRHASRNAVSLGPIPPRQLGSPSRFQRETKHWLGAHEMFRRVAERIRLDTEGVLSNEMGLDDYVGRLSYYGGNLVGNLHGHHGWEDHSYFPELSAADPRFDAGLELLEKDHLRSG